MKQKIVSLMLIFASCVLLCQPLYAQKNLGGYSNIVMGVALKQGSISYNGESTPDNFFYYVLVSKDKEVIVTNDQFDERFRFAFSKTGESKGRYIFTDKNMKKAFCIDVSGGTVMYADLNSDMLMLYAEIDFIRTAALQDVIKND